MPPTRDPSDKRLLVAIPCLNEAATIAAVVSAIPRQIEGLADVQVLVVDDGSSDATAAEATGAGATVISHARNKGVGMAMRTAVEYALLHEFDLMVNIDGDGQFNPADIAKLVQPVLRGEADMVTASRFIDPALVPDMPKAKLWGNRMMSLLISFLVGERFYDVSCGFRGYNREGLLQLNLHGAFTYTQETFIDFAAKHMRILEVPIPVRYFADRKSRVAGNLFKYAARTAKIIFRGYRDYFPLRFFWFIALVLLVPGLGFAAMFITHFIATGKFTGYLFAGFGSAFLIGFSLIFFVAGFLADMLARIRMNQERVLYLLKKRNGSAKQLF